MKFPRYQVKVTIQSSPKHATKQQPIAGLLAEPRTSIRHLRGLKYLITMATTQHYSYSQNRHNTALLLSKIIGGRLIHVQRNLRISYLYLHKIIILVHLSAPACLLSSHCKTKRCVGSYSRRVLPQCNMEAFVELASTQPTTGI